MTVKKAPTSVGYSGTVLVVDDLGSNLDLLRRLLTAQGYTVITAGDGQEALEIVSREAPDVGGAVLRLRKVPLQDRTADDEEDRERNPQ